MFKVSIITAAYRANLMDRVWESIKNQTHKDWEWIIVNDAQQGIRDWYKQFKKENPEVNVWMVDIERQKGRFGLFSRNIGIIVANYEHICFLDDDNEWDPSHLETLINLEEKTGKVPYCWMHIKGKKKDSDCDRIKKTHFGKQGIDLGCILWTRRLLEQYGLFRDDSQVTYDWNCIARMYYGYGPSRFECTEKPSLVFWHKRY